MDPCGYPLLSGVRNTSTARDANLTLSRRLASASTASCQGSLRACTVLPQRLICSPAAPTTTLYTLSYSVDAMFGLSTAITHGSKWHTCLLIYSFTSKPYQRATWRPRVHPCFQHHTNQRNPAHQPLINMYSKYQKTHEISLPSRSIESMLSTSRSHLVKSVHILLIQRDDLSVRLNSGGSHGFG
jgi:hypothetical protein